MLPMKVCKSCVGSGIDLKFFVESKEYRIIGCEQCNGTGYRTWIDEIRRPCSKDYGKRINEVSGV